MAFKFDEDSFEKMFYDKYDGENEFELSLYTFAENFTSKKSVSYNKNIVKYYYGTTENAVKVYEKAWNLEYHKDCLSNGKRKAYIELAAITLYKVFYGKFTST